MVRVVEFSSIFIHLAIVSTIVQAGKSVLNLESANVLVITTTERSRLLVIRNARDSGNNISSQPNLELKSIISSTFEPLKEDQSSEKQESMKLNSSSIDLPSGGNAEAANNMTSLIISPTQQQNTDSADEVPLYMQHMTTILVIMHMSVFITGLVGNSLVCLSVFRNKSLQTVTNYYIVNLAVADFLVILICLPPTVYWDLTLTWNFGLILCKLVLYLQVSAQEIHCDRVRM